MNSQFFQPAADEGIHDTVGRLASLVYKLEASKDAEQRSGIIRQMHRASTLLQLLLQIECECEDAGRHVADSPCERAARSDLASYSTGGPDGDCPIARTATESQRRQPDTNGEEVSP